MEKHTHAKALTPAFEYFCDETFRWLTGALCDQGGADGDIWRPRYEASVKAYRSKSQFLTQETVK